MSKRNLAVGLLAAVAVAALVVAEIATSGSGASQRPAPSCPRRYSKGQGSTSPRFTASLLW